MGVFVDFWSASKAKLGEVTDLWTTKQTVLGYANASYKHIHNPGRVTPADGTVVTVTTAQAGATFGAFADVIAANQIASQFDIHWISITDIEANGVHVIELHRLNGAGESEALLGQVVVARTAQIVKVGQVFTQIPVQAANARVGARVLSDVGTEKFVKFVAHYHDYE